MMLTIITSTVTLPDDYYCTMGHDLVVKSAELDKLKAKENQLQLEIDIIAHNAREHAKKCGTMLQMMIDADKMTPIDVFNNVAQHYATNDE